MGKNTDSIVRTTLKYRVCILELKIVLGHLIFIVNLIWNCLGDTPLGTSVFVLGGRTYLSVGSTIL